MSALLGSIIPDERFSLLDFVEQANRLLPRFLPESSTDSRQREEVNIRLVRHMTTLGLLDEAQREGRESRYTGKQLLQLLVVRRLMAEGYTTGAIKKLIAGASIERLEALLEGEAQPTVEVVSPLAMESEPIAMSRAMPRESAAPAENAALDYLHKLRQRKKTGREDDNYQSRASPLPAPGARLPAAPPTAPPAVGTPTAARSIASRPVAPLQWTRVEVLPGLEVHVREDFALPTTPYEQERLLQRAVEELKAIRAGGTPATKRRSS
jgi:DNA-binding transcriptional MerR regulator